MPPRDEPLVVESRPSVQWVASLPASWTPNPSQRLVLLALACDAFDDTSAPGVDHLARWVGLSRGQTFALLAELCQPFVESGRVVRPPLLVRVDRQGNALDNGARRGRDRTGYRLNVTVQPPGRSESREPSSHPDGRTSQPSSHPDGSTDRQQSGEPDGLSHQPSGQPSGGPDAPIPSLPTTKQVTNPRTDRARDVADDWSLEDHEEQPRGDDDHELHERTPVLPVVRDLQVIPQVSPDPESLDATPPAVGARRLDIRSATPGPAADLDRRKSARGPRRWPPNRPARWPRSTP